MKTHTQCSMDVEQHGCDVTDEMAETLNMLQARHGNDAIWTAYMDQDIDVNPGGGIILSLELMWQMRDQFNWAELAYNACDCLQWNISHDEVFGWTPVTDDQINEFLDIYFAE